MVVGVWWYDDFGINQGDQCIVKLSRLTPGKAFHSGLLCRFHSSCLLLAGEREV